MDNEATNTIEQTEPETQPVQPESEPTQANPYETIIAQQQAQIDALIKQSNICTQQITNLIQNGAQLGVQAGVQAAKDIQPDTQQNAFNPKSLAETDAFLSMEDLAKEIGKH